jgi:hypothetical protein
VLTGLIGDLASMAGCCLGMPDEITAITIVALGTSLPDTFASLMAAQNEKARASSRRRFFCPPPPRVLPSGTRRATSRSQWGPPA